jgi:hypothetical protein
LIEIGKITKTTLIEIGKITKKNRFFPLVAIGTTIYHGPMELPKMTACMETACADLVEY